MGLILSVFAVAASGGEFRGPDSNPVGTDKRLADRWSKTENVEWGARVTGWEEACPKSIGSEKK